MPNGKVIEVNTSTHSLDLRSRYELTADWALVNKDQEKGHWNLQVASEIMVQRWNYFFDTTRFYAGLQHFLSNKIRLELGYLKSVEKEFDYDVDFAYDNIRFTFRHRL